MPASTRHCGAFLFYRNGIHPLMLCKIALIGSKQAESAAAVRRSRGQGKIPCKRIMGPWRIACQFVKWARNAQLAGL